MAQMQIKNFARDWKNRGYEKGEAQPFWLAFIRDVFDIPQPEKFISFETQVKIDGTTKFIDAYLFDSKVLIEQKTFGVKLDDAVFKQAKNYDNALNFTRKARWIITCNFQEFLIYNMETLAPPIKILLEELPDKFHAFDFLIKKNRQNFEPEKALTFNVGVAIQKLYQELLTLYQNKNSPETFRSLNKLCVRLVFCFYAESADIFPEFKMFSDYLSQFKDKAAFRSALLELFKILSTPKNLRSPYISDQLKKFPYIDGGLFDDDNFDFPEFSQRARDIFADLAKMKWRDIDPTIFGAVFESTLNPENFSKNIRRESGIHYTAPQNIQKLIKPLFLDALKEKFSAVTSRQDLFDLQNLIANIKILDPACGSGNFLTESFLLLRELENDIIEALAKDGVKFAANPIKISIKNFFGIEINDFAVAVAKTALWISDIQMRKKISDALELNLPHFPLEKNLNIICQNALTFDWQNLISPAELNFIVGNPPFIATKSQTPQQKADVLAVCKDFKPLDYVCCWYKKASDFIQGSNIRCAFVSTNSITQGEQVAPLWKNLNVHIDFAYKTFKWHSESPKTANVHVVIIGFSCAADIPKFIFDRNNKIPAHNINGYLIDAPNILVESRSKPICNVPEIVKGSIIIDDGNLIISGEEYENFIKKEPLAKQFIRRYIGADDFINDKRRYVLWLVNCSPHLLVKMKNVAKRIHAVKKFRENSKRARTVKAAETPYLFAENRQPDSDYIAIPVTSSENRRYIPIGFMSKEIIANGDIQMIPDATVYEFGVLISSVHMAWVRAVAGRLELRYRYSASVVYNNFIWCAASLEQRRRIEDTAQGILDVLTKYPESTLAELYDEEKMPVELRRAHELNDLAVKAAYGFSASMTEPEIVSKLFELYQKATGGGKFITKIEWLPLSMTAGELLELQGLRKYYYFGVLTSSVHMIWVRAVCGRLKSDYRYSASVVYNNFAWSSPTLEQWRRVAECARRILSVRAKYAESSLADLYAEESMPVELRRAHELNDAAVKAAYGFSENMSEGEILRALLEKYLELTEKR